jgi:threonine/homoserine/homoserine lactone efflux protein
MSATEITTLFVLCAAMSFSPGPNTTMATALAANGGMRQALRFCIAVPAGWSLMMMACGFGLGALVLGSPPLRLGIKLLGIGYMVWLAWKLSRAAQFASVDARRLNVGFWNGVGLQFVNIKAWMLALTLTAGWVVNAAGRPAPNPGQRLAIVCAVMLLFAFASNFSYALLGSLLRDWLAQGHRLRWFNRLLALVLLATAGWMLAV